MTPEDFMRARELPHTPRDWSKLTLWASLAISATMIMATIMWNVGKELRINSYLKEHGVKTCVQLHEPPGQQPEDASPFSAECEQVVDNFHDTCLDTTQHVRHDLLERRSQYMACLMASQPRRAALD